MHGEDRQTVVLRRSSGTHLSGAMVNILTMGRTISMAFVLNIMLIGLVVGSAMADSNIRENRGGHQQVHSRRLLVQAASATPLPAFRSGPICGGLGPVCPGNVHIECAVGGVVGCICHLVHTCQPSVSGCTLFNGAAKTPCGF